MQGSRVPDGALPAAFTAEASGAWATREVSSGRIWDPSLSWPASVQNIITFLCIAPFRPLLSSKDALMLDLLYLSRAASV